MKPVIKYVRIFSDVHLDGKNCSGKARVPNRYWMPEHLDTDPETLLLVAGDVADTEVVEFSEYVRFFAALNDRFAKVLYVPGNHEHCGTKFPLFNTTMKECFVNHFGDEVQLLDNELVEVEVDGKVLLVAGTTLWTSFANDNPLVTIAANKQVRDFHAITGFSTTAAYREHQLALSFLDLVRRYLKGMTPEQQEKVELVVLTHFAPLPLSGHAKFLTSILTDYFCNELSRVMLKLGKPNGKNLWVHGHTHSLADYSFDDWRVCCNPVGYTGENTGYCEDFVIPVTDLHEGIDEIVPMNLEVD